MTPVTACAGRHLALFGLGGSGLATAQALVAGGATVTAWDESEASRAKAEALGLTVEDLWTADWQAFSALVLAPGVPLTHPAPHWTVTLAGDAGLPVIGDIELFCLERARIAPDAPFIAITGTNGKSTTTALTAHLFRTAGWDVQMGGNIGVPVLALARPANDRVHVLELSSFQIDLAPSLKPTLGMLINLTPDHLDRHGSMESYAAIKERLVTAADRALVGVDDPFSLAIVERLRQRPDGAGDRQLPVSVQDRLDQGIWLDGTRIMAATGRGDPRVLGDLAGVPALRGRHNAQNACFALGAADIWDLGRFGLGNEGVLQRGLASFPGLAHRMEQVGTRGRVLFVNDSKATNADAAAQSLASFDPIHWIVGGVAKEGGVVSLAPLMGRVAKAYLIGASSDVFETELAGKVPIEHCGTLDIAVQAAAQDAAHSQAPEPVVLLAPACASYDQYKNFEVRGDHFRALVAALPAHASGPRGDVP